MPWRIFALERENPVPGEDPQLHLDLRLQRKAHELLEGWRGAIIAIEPATGGILALASVPGFDANKFVTGISVKDYWDLVKASTSPCSTGPAWPVSPAPPSSLMAVAALDSGVTTREQLSGTRLFPARESGRRYRD